MEACRAQKLAGTKPASVHLSFGFESPSLQSGAFCLLKLFRVNLRQENAGDHLKDGIETDGFEQTATDEIGLHNWHTEENRKFVKGC